jgi:Ca2+-transporting ATPase
MQEIFKTEALTAQELLIAVAISSSVFWLVEIEKWIKRIRDRRRASAEQP